MTLTQRRCVHGGWKNVERSRAYTIKDGPRAPHRVYVHPEFSDLRATVGRHRSLAQGYATTAVRLIDTLRARRAVRETGQAQGDLV